MSAAAPPDVGMNVYGTAAFYAAVRPLARRWWSRDGHLHLGWGDGPQEEALGRMVAEVAAQAGITHGCRVADLGCGPGGPALWLLARFAALDVHEVNLPHSHVATATAWARQLELAARARFLPGDYAWAPLEDRRAALSEARRLLRLGGRVAVADLCLGNRPEPALAEWARSWAVPALPRLEELAQELREAGFARPGGGRDRARAAVRSAAAPSGPGAGPSGGCGPGPGAGPVGRGGRAPGRAPLVAPAPRALRFYLLWAEQRRGTFGLEWAMSVLQELLLPNWTIWCAPCRG